MMFFPETLRRQPKWLVLLEAFTRLGCCCCGHWRHHFLAARDSHAFAMSLFGVNFQCEDHGSEAVGELQIVSPLR